MRGTPRLLIALVIAVISVLGYFGTRSTNEVTGEVQHVAITPDQEVALGLQAAPQMAQQFGGEVNNPVSDYVESVGQRVVSQSIASGSPYRFDFHLLADPETINAFALPGGQIYITVGLLRRLGSEAELAGVLGHEIGHVVGRHGAEHLSKQQLTQGLLGAATIAAADPNDPAATRQRAAMAAMVGQMINMRFGRKDELESDSLGVMFMTEAKYDPRGMLQLMRVLSEGGGRGTPEFMSTHPDPGNRLARLEELIERSGARGTDRGEDRFRERVLSQLR